MTLLSHLRLDAPYSATPIIGFVGKKGHGKSTAGKVLQTLGYVQAHPAEPLRAMLDALLRFYGYSDGEIEDFLTGPRKRDIIPEIGKTSTYLQQTLGTEWGRKCLGEDFWTNLLWRRFAQVPFYNDSIRFKSEAEFILAKGGVLIRVYNSRIPPDDLDTHSSETEQDGIAVHFFLPNDGTKTQLAHNLLGIMREIEARHINVFHPPGI